MNLNNVPEPEELTQWANKRAEERAAKAAADAQVCVRCGKTRGHQDHIWGANTLTVRCRFLGATTSEVEE